MGKTFALIVIGGMSLFGVSRYLSQEKTTTVPGVVVSELATATSTEKSAIQTASSTDNNAALKNLPVASTTPSLPTPRVVTHIKAPSPLRAFYMTSWVAGTNDFKERLIASAESAHMNALVIDVKDNTGTVSWNGRIKKDELEKLIDDLHSKGFYLIARITAFQDPLFAKAYPSEAIKKADGTLWKSKKGEAWVDPGSHAMWNYLFTLGEESYTLGFDEVNLDYIRFSTDGLKENLTYPRSGKDGNDIKLGGREKVIDEFYTYITGAFRGKGIPVSGDVFGIITTSKEDTLVLGQNFGSAIQHFDYVAPMVYPSHYAPGSFGYQNPAAHPGPVITEALKGALAIVDSVSSSTGQATSTLAGKIRPWYQDFNMGATYTAELVKSQITAGNALGVTSYMMWDPNNKYTAGAYR